MIQTELLSQIITLVAATAVGIPLARLLTDTIKHLIQTRMIREDDTVTFVIINADGQAKQVTVDTTDESSIEHFLNAAQEATVAG